MNHSHTLPRDAWIDAAQEDVANQVEPFLSATPISGWPTCLGDVIERHFEAHRKALPTAEPLDLSPLGHECLRHSARLLRLRPWDDNPQADLVIQQASILLRNVFDALCTPRGLIAPPGAGQEVGSQQS